MTEKEFYSLCSMHDWWFDYSDDHGVYLKGFDEERRISKALEENPALRPSYNEFLDRLKGN